GWRARICRMGRIRAGLHARSGGCKRACVRESPPPCGEGEGVGVSPLRRRLQKMQYALAVAQRHRAAARPPPLPLPTRGRESRAPHRFLHPMPCPDGPRQCTGRPLLLASPRTDSSGARAAGLMPETSLYRPVKKYLEGLGFAVKGEVVGCDVVGIRES